jgi:lipopolysaccharide export system protein LptC
MNRHVPPHELQRRDAASFAPRAAPDFQRAARHSTRVRWFRRILPISLGVTLAVLTAIPFLSSLDLKLELPFDIGRLTLSGTRLTMEEPKLSGFTDDKRGYSVNARTAEQDLSKPDLVDLTDIEARMELADKGWTTVVAKTGTMNVKSQFITLSGGVDLAMKGGYAGTLKDADVDVKAGTIVTQKPVVFTYQDAKLVADTLTVTDRGAKALFVGNVQLDFVPSTLSAAQNAAPATAEAKPQPKAAPAKGTAPVAPVAQGASKPPAVATATPAPGAATPGLPAGALVTGAVSSAFASTESTLPVPYWSLPASVTAPSAPPAAGAASVLPPPAPLPPRRPEPR